MQNKIILTEDGSHTIYVPGLEEHYHSTHGAINESMHIYINAGLKASHKKELTIYEVGFGTGLNAILTLIHGRDNKLKINYYTIEKYPVSIENILQLNYLNLENSEYKNLFIKMHESSWNEQVQLTPDFSITKLKADIKSIDYNDFPFFDLIYFDAFAPSKQPEVWSEDIFHKISSHSNERAIIVTYCAKGSVRRMLRDFGFQMERLPGPIGKKEILRGTKL